MHEPGATPYDEIPYPGQSHPQSHPDRLAVIAALRGFPATPPGRCRVLELGCGDGSNLLAMAQHAPESEFVGVDLAATSVEQGRRIAAALGWGNVDLRHGDIANLPADLGTFDYVISHGVYSWVPAHVREALIATCAERLGPSGVAFVSYVVYPGAHLGQMLREMLLIHTRPVADPRERITSALDLLRFLATSRESDDPWRQTVTREFERALERRGTVLRHDELGDVRDPVWWHEFASHAARHGLQFLGEADWFEMLGQALTEEARKILDPLPFASVTREQYLDFAKCRRFRQTLLCRAGTELAPEPRMAAVRTFHVAGRVTSAAERADLASTTAERFTATAGGAVETDSPLIRAALRTIGDSFPRRFRFDELLAVSRDLLTSAGAPPRAPAEDASLLEETLFRLYESGVVRFHALAAPCVLEAGERPRSSRLARVQVRSRDTVTSLVNENVNLADETSRGLVLLLDGTRDRPAIVEALHDHLRRLGSGAASSSEDAPPSPGAPASSAPAPAGDASELSIDAAGLETALAGLARVGLVEG